MTVREIEAKTLLAAVRQPDPYFGLKYVMNLYRGCQHRCIYCDSRSECYGIEAFDSEVLVKRNALELLRDELSRKRVKGVVGLGSMNDPYMPLELERRLTRSALEALAERRFPVHVITKGALVARDADVLAEIGRVFAAVSFTVTCADDALCARIEPGASRTSERFEAMAALARAGVRTGVTLMPVLPFLTDDPANLEALVARAAQSGASYVLASLGVTLRDRQRAYFYAQLDRSFPGLHSRYEASFGERYYAPARGAPRLEAALRLACERHGLATSFDGWKAAEPTQLRLL